MRVQMVKLDTPLLHSIVSAAKILGIGRSSLYALIAENKIHPVKIGRRTLIPNHELERFVEDLLAEPR